MFAIPWSNTNAGWQDGNSQPADGTSVLGSSISTSPNYPLTSCVAETVETQGVGQGQAIDNIKSVLGQNKSIYFSFYLPNHADWAVFENFWFNEPESAVWSPDYSNGHTWVNGEGEGAGHGVLCVGYNDTDPNNSYWIMVNSWGTTAGRPNGIFHVNMTMNYDCWLYGLNGGYSIEWQTLDVDFDLESQPVVISNVGNDFLGVSSVECDQQWLSVYQPGPSSFDLAPGETQTVLVRADKSGLVAGTYYGNVNVYSNDADENPLTVTVTMNVEPANLAVPLDGWQVNSGLTNAPYVLSSTEPELSLELGADNTGSKVAIYSFDAPQLSLSDYACVDVSVTGSANARVLLRFFLDSGSSFDVVYWASPSVLDAKLFDLTPYAGSSLSGLVYVALMSSDGSTANIDITDIAFEVPSPPSPLVPLSGWQVNPGLTNAPYVLSSGESALSLELDASSTSSKVAVYSLGMSKLSLADYGYVDVSVTGTANARVLLRFFLDDGSSFDVVYWGSPTVLDAVSFDLSSYAGRSLSGLVYVAVMSSDGSTASIDITAIVFEAPAPPSPLVPLSGWVVNPSLTNAPYTLSSTESALSLELEATSTSSKVAVYTFGVSKLSLVDYGYVDVAVTGTDNARILLRFFLDDGSSFDVTYWGSPAALNAVNFDLSPYTGRTLTGLVYVALMSSDGSTASIDVTGIAFES
jgi:hypothetical protein